eukprot:GILJ01008135.1.p1 GENE.GILJ01008135.1~~GILJ01008135.1.p1  ORF type:complete len:597 (-),score=130.90 GILJ01008135.1:136-1926(-)
MGKRQKKGEKGAVAAYITRSQAVRKLQISLKDFRRLCILKGIFPRDPKKKASGRDKTYYSIKDINFLAHEPLLQKFREIKTYLKRHKKALGRGEKSIAESLEKRKPVYSLHHLIKERYPSFTDALRDIDDALCMIHLFAALPADSRYKIPVDRIQGCQRLAFEFQEYVVRSRSLQKTFLSIKGIYYQANIAGQTVTWLVPYQFSQELPPDVDYRVMLTFLEFYEVLVKFVNFRLYASIGLRYPPKLNEELEQGGAGLSALQVESNSASASKTENAVETKQNKKAMKQTAERLATLQDKLQNMPEEEQNEDAADEDASELTTDFADSAEVKAIVVQNDQLEQFQKLFTGFRFFLSRETPRPALEFLLKSFGGEVGWDGPGSPFDEENTKITHQIMDRPSQKHQFFNREYVQPQWVFDSVNARFLLPVPQYTPGKVLPPHLSPFVDDESVGYIPEQKKAIEKLRKERAGLLDTDAMEVEQGDEDEEETEEMRHARELAAEAEGATYSSTQQKENSSEEEDGDEDEEEETKPAKAPVRTAKQKRAPKVSAEEEEKELAKIMMPKKHKRLYSRMQHGIQKKASEVEQLETKKRKLQAGKK